MRTALILALAPTLALCQEPEPMGHIGLQVGQAQYETEVFDADGTIYSLYGGGRAGQYFVGELAASETRKLSDGPVSVEARIYSVRFLGRYPFDRFAILAGVGVNRIETETSALGFSIDESDSEPSWIVAGEFATEDFLFRVAYEAVDTDIDNAEASAIMVGMAYRFQ